MLQLRAFVSFKYPLRIAQFLLFGFRLLRLALSTSSLVRATRAAGDREVHYWIGNTCASISVHLVDDFYFNLIFCCDSAVALFFIQWKSAADMCEWNEDESRHCRCFNFA